MNNSNQIIGYDPQTGQPIYANNNVQNPQMINNQQFGNQNIQQPINYQNYQNQNLQQPMINKKNNKNYLWIVIILIIIILAVIGIFYLFNSKNLTNKDRTIMIYMVGSNLESNGGLGTTDLNAINYDEVSKENINVLVIAGGSKDWKNDYIDEDETSIYKLTANGFVKEKSQSLQNMGDDKVFTNFLNYVYENYKSDEYDLIFWNHGGGVLGSESDELYNHDLLELKEIKQGLYNSSFNKNNKLEAIIFRTCLNGTIEVADTLKDYSDYLIASEEVTLGYSEYGVLSFINDLEKADDGYDIGVKFINKYKDFIKNLKQIYLNRTGESEYIYSTYSVVDLSEIDELEKSFEDFISDINLTTNYNTIARVRSNLYQYAYTDSASPSGAYDAVDFYNLVDSLKELSPTKADKVLKNFEKVVLYNYATNSKSRGLSIYFPYNGTDSMKKSILSLYSSFGSLNDYREFIVSFYNLQSSSTNTYSFANNNVKVDTVDETADFTLELTDEQKETFAKASYIVFRDNKDGYYLPVYRSNEVTMNGNMLNANIKDRQLKVVSSTDASENIITLIEVSNGEDFIKYNSNVILEDFSSEDLSDFVIESASISLIYNKKTGEVNIGNAVLNSTEENIPSSVAVDLNDYTHIAFASSKYKILDENGNYNENWESNGVIEGLEEKINDIKFELQDFNDGYDYYCVFKIWDTNNDSYYSKLVKMN